MQVLSEGAAKAWERLLSDPMLEKCMKNAQETKEEIAWRVLSSGGPEIDRVERV